MYELQLYHDFSQIGSDWPHSIHVEVNTHTDNEDNSEPWSGVKVEEHSSQMSQPVADLQRGTHGNTIHN